MESDLGKIGDDDWRYESFIENSGELQQFSIRCSCKRETKNEVATSSSISRARVNPDHVFARSSSGGVNRSQ